MNMKLPFHQRDVGHWFEMTNYLTIEEIGMLTFLENCYWRSGELPPEDDLLRAMEMRRGDVALMTNVRSKFFPEGRCPHLDPGREDAIAKSQGRSKRATEQHAKAKTTRATVQQADSYEPMTPQQREWDRPIDF